MCLCDSTMNHMNYEGALSIEACGSISVLHSIMGVELEDKNLLLLVGGGSNFVIPLIETLSSILFYSLLIDFENSTAPVACAAGRW